MEDNQFEQGEVFNMGIATLMRFDKLLTLCCRCALSGDYHGWYKGLLQLRRNLKPFLKEEEWKAICGKLEDIPNDAWMSGKEGMKIRPTRFQQVYQTLDELDMLMQEQMKEHGLLMPKKDDPSRALLG